MAKNENLMTTEDTLLAYSEWLDSQGLIVGDKTEDSRSHDELAKQFVEDWESDPNRATLAGRVFIRAFKKIREAIDLMDGK